MATVKIQNIPLSLETLELRVWDCLFASLVNLVTFQDRKKLVSQHVKAIRVGCSPVERYAAAAEKRHNWKCPLRSKVQPEVNLKHYTSEIQF